VADTRPLHRVLGLTDGEHGRIRSLLGRDPNDFELAVFSLLWSEHCGYKHSALLLRRLPTDGERVLQGPGENAGVLDLGDGVRTQRATAGQELLAHLHGQDRSRRQSKPVHQRLGNDQSA